MKITEILNFAIPTALITASIVISFHFGRTTQYMSSIEKHHGCRVELKAFKTAHYDAENALKELGLGR